jgi:RimJ/RimL family protein N-acetyltransferase
MRSTNPSFSGPLDLHGCRALADVLGDGPETVIAVHVLERGLCKAYVAGPPSQFTNAIVQTAALPGEPIAFGADPHVLRELLKLVDGWQCVLVDADCASGLGELIEKERGSPVRYVDDVYHTLTAPVPAFQDDAVRLLAEADARMLQAIPPEFRAGFWGSPEALLAEGIVAGAVIAGEVVATALTAARSRRCADIAVYTREQFRNRGLATAAASLVARSVQQAGQTPVWSTGEQNIASLRVARKLHFVQVSRRTYVVPENRSPARE